MSVKWNKSIVIIK